MTTNSEFSHRRAEFKARLQMSIAARVFSHSRSGLDGLVKRLMKTDQAPTYTDPELEHPAQENGSPERAHS